MSGQRVLAIVGPTAVGKTALAIELALRLGGEVISGDSMQVYRGLDIGTAKPTPAEMRGVPHHLIDIRDPDQDYNVADFQAEADQAIAAVAGRGRLPIVAGGTGLYIRALLRGFAFAEMEMDPELRARLTDEAERLGAPALHSRLAAVDPAAASRIHPNDQRRIVRALEVYALTGRPISELQQAGAWQPRYDHLLVGLTMERTLLYRRIDQRVEQMLAAGWEQEVRRLLAAGLRPLQGPMGNLGYRELVAYLRGLNTWAETVDWIKRNTRRYAKRQLTWFRREPDIHWVEAAHGLSAAVDGVLRLIEGKWSAAGEVRN